MNPWESSIVFFFFRSTPYFVNSLDDAREYRSDFLIRFFPGSFFAIRANVEDDMASIYYLRDLKCNFEFSEVRFRSRFPPSNSA